MDLTFPHFYLFTLHLLMDNVFSPLNQSFIQLYVPYILIRIILMVKILTIKNYTYFQIYFCIKFLYDPFSTLFKLPVFLYVFSIELTETFRNIFFHFTGSVHFKLLKLLSIFIPEQIHTNFVHKINVDYISLVSVKF